MNVAVIIYKGIELVDMNGPIDVFLHANSFNNSRYHVYTVAASPAAIHSEWKVVTITPEYTLDNCPDPDIIVVPGTLNDKGSPNVADTVIVNWVKQMADSKKIILSVCIGLYTLAKSGILSCRKATTHYLSINYIHTNYPDIDLVKNVRFVEDGNIISTGGITSGIDGALHLIEKYDGATVAQQVADIMVYNRSSPLPPYTILPPYYFS
ncbi:MAG: transcriptional regulator, AraC family [Segetibacter sp.]|nr:transcriptional regulator, AraC family [Segetibacter sp.]